MTDTMNHTTDDRRDEHSPLLDANVITVLPLNLRVIATMDQVAVALGDDSNLRSAFATLVESFLLYPSDEGDRTLLRDTLAQLATMTALDPAHDAKLRRGIDYFKAEYVTPLKAVVAPRVLDPEVEAERAARQLRSAQAKADRLKAAAAVAKAARRDPVEPTKARRAGKAAGLGTNEETAE